MKGIAKKVLSYLLIITCVITTLPYITEPTEVQAGQIAGFKTNASQAGGTGSVKPKKAVNAVAVGYRISLYCTKTENGNNYLPSIANDENKAYPIMKSYATPIDASKYESTSHLGESYLTQTYYRDLAAKKSGILILNRKGNNFRTIHQLKPSTDYTRTAMYWDTYGNELSNDRVVRNTTSQNKVFKLLNDWSGNGLTTFMNATWRSTSTGAAKIVNPDVFNAVDKKLGGQDGAKCKEQLIEAFKPYMTDAYYEKCKAHPESVYLQVEPVAIVTGVVYDTNHGFLTTWSDAKLALSGKATLKEKTHRGVFSWRKKGCNIYNGAIPLTYGDTNKKLKKANDSTAYKDTTPKIKYFTRKYVTKGKNGKKWGCNNDLSLCAMNILGTLYNSKIWNKTTQIKAGYCDRGGIGYYGCSGFDVKSYKSVETISLLFNGALDEDTLEITNGTWQQTSALSVFRDDISKNKDLSTYNYTPNQDMTPLTNYVDIVNQNITQRYKNIYTYTKNTNYKKTETNAKGQVGFSNSDDLKDYNLVGFYSYLIHNKLKTRNTKDIAKLYTDKVNDLVSQTRTIFKDNEELVVPLLQASWKPNVVGAGDDGLNAGFTISLRNLYQINNNGSKLSDKASVFSVVKNSIVKKVYKEDKYFGISRIMQYPYYGTPSSDSFTTATMSSSKNGNILGDEVGGFDVQLLLNKSRTGYAKATGNTIATNLLSLTGKSDSLATQAYYLEGATFRGLLGTEQTTMKKLAKIQCNKKYALNVLVGAKVADVTSYYTWSIWDFKKEALASSGTETKKYDITSYGVFPLESKGQKGLRRVMIVPNAGSMQKDSESKIAMTQEELEGIVTQVCQGANEYASEKTIMKSIWDEITNNLTVKSNDNNYYPESSTVCQYMKDLLNEYGSNSETALYKPNGSDTAAVGFYQSDKLDINNLPDMDITDNTEEGADAVSTEVEPVDDNEVLDEDEEDFVFGDSKTDVDEDQSSTAFDEKDNLLDGFPNVTFATFNIKMTEEDFVHSMSAYLKSTGVKSIYYIEDSAMDDGKTYKLGDKISSKELQNLVKALDKGTFAYLDGTDDDADFVFINEDKNALEDICSHIQSEIPFYGTINFMDDDDNSELPVSDADPIDGEIEDDTPIGAEVGIDLGNTITNMKQHEQRGYTIIAVGYTGKRVRTAGIELQPWELNYVYADLQAALMYNTQQVARMQKDSTGKPIESEHNNFDVGYLGGAYASTLSSNSTQDLHSKADIWSYTGVHSTSYCNDGHVPNNNVVKRDTESHNTRDAWVDYIPSKESWDNDNTLFSYNVIVSDETKGRSGIEDNSKDENYAYWINANKLHANNDNDTDKNNYSLFLYSNPIMNDIWSVANSSRGYNNTSINWSTWSRLSKNFNYDNDYKKHYFTVNTMRESAYLSYVYNLIRYISGDERVVSSIYNYDADENIIKELKDTKETSVQEFLEKCLLMKSANIPNLDVSKLSQTSSVIGNNKRAVRTLYNKDYLNGSVPKGAISEHLVLNAYMQDDNDDLGTGNNIDIRTNNTTGDTPVYHTRKNAHSGQDKTIQWTHKVAHDVPLQSGEHCHYQIGIDTYSWSDENGVHTYTVSTRIDHECYHERKIRGVMPAAFLFRTVNIDTGNINEEENEDTYNLDYSEKIYKYITDKMDIGENNTDTGIIDTNGEIDNSTKDNLTVKPSSTTSTTQNALPEMVTSKTPDTLGNNNSNINTNFSSAFFDSQRDAMDTMNKVTFGYFPEVNMLSYVYDKGQTLSGKNGVALSVVPTMGEIGRASKGASLYFMTTKNSNYNSNVTKGNMSDADYIASNKPADFEGKTYSDSVATGTQASNLGDNFNLFNSNKSLRQVIYAGSDVTVTGDANFSLNLYGYALDLIDYDKDTKLTVEDTSVTNSYATMTRDYKYIVADNSNIYKNWYDIFTDQHNRYKDIVAKDSKTKVKSAGDNYNAICNRYKEWVTQTTNLNNWTADYTLNVHDSNYNSKFTDFSATIGSLKTKDNKTAIDVDVTKQTDVYPLHFKNGELITTDGGYVALINQIAMDYYGDEATDVGGQITLTNGAHVAKLKHYDCAETLFKKSSIGSSILNAIESSNSTFNKSESCFGEQDTFKKRGNSIIGSTQNWYDEEVRTVVVRRFATDPLYFKNITASDKVDYNCAPTSNTTVDDWTGRAADWYLNITYKDVAAVNNLPFKVKTSSGNNGFQVVRDLYVDNASFIVPSATTDNMGW